jgi:hypothetical protein
MEPYLYSEDDLIGRLVLEEGEYLERGSKVIRYSVVHYYEFAFGRTNLECLVSYKLVMLHSLMEITVVENDASDGIGVGKGDIIVENQLQSGIASKVALHLNAAVDGRVNHIP